jgi:mono/diheme cytochrome c family protein
MGSFRFRARHVASVLIGGVLIGALGACGSESRDRDVIAGKQEFVKSCGACHVLARAGTKGTQGPNLDEAFRQALLSGLGRNTVEGVVHDQILNPARLPKNDPAYMPAKLVTGEKAKNVAAYVALVAGSGGKDSGRLADAVKAPGSDKPIAAKDGVLAMPADPNGQLAYASTQATAEPGPLKIDSKNDANIPHDIALEGGGVNEKGEAVQDGGTSTIEVDVQAGEYTYYCTLPGHRDGGMEGKLTVK